MSGLIFVVMWIILLVVLSGYSSWVFNRKVFPFKHVLLMIFLWIYLMIQSVFLKEVTVTNDVFSAVNFTILGLFLVNNFWVARKRERSGFKK